MKKDPRIRSAMDESLSSVHFDARDMHAVLRSVHHRAAPRRAKRRHLSPAPAFAAAMAVLVLTPVVFLALRAGSMTPTDITTIAAHGNSTPATVSATPAVITADGQQDLLRTHSPAPVSAAFSADDAIMAARACFEANCDTTIFTFDEYTVDVQAEYAYGSDSSVHDYLVTMNSIYGNGCSFRCVVSSSGEVLSYSAPHLATVPTHLSAESTEIRSWYEKYGDHLFTWPMEVQAEFSRRYEGAMLRMPRENELDEATIARKLGMHHQTLIDACPKDGCTHHTISYCMSLRSERAYDDGQARYLVYCFLTDDLASPLPSPCMRLTFLASNGTLEAKEIIPTDEL